jgi:hypothetical protein
MSWFLRLRVCVRFVCASSIQAAGPLSDLALGALACYLNDQMEKLVASSAPALIARPFTH